MTNILIPLSLANYPMVKSAIEQEKESLYKHGYLKSVNADFGTQFERPEDAITFIRNENLRIAGTLSDLGQAAADFSCAAAGFKEVLSVYEKPKWKLKRIKKRK